MFAIFVKKRTSFQFERLNFPAQTKQLRSCLQRKPLETEVVIYSAALLHLLVSKIHFFCKMGNVQGQHGDPTRKHSEAGHGLVFNGDKHQREMSPFDPVSHLTFYELWNVIPGVLTSFGQEFSKKSQNFKKRKKLVKVCLHSR